MSEESMRAPGSGHEEHADAETAGKEPAAAAPSHDPIKDMRLPAETLAALQAMNERHAFIGYGGRTRFLDVLDNPGRYDLPYQFLDRQTFEGFYQSEPDVFLLKSKYDQTRQCTVWVPVSKPLTWAWQHWPQRPRYRRVGFYPSCAVPADAFNLWEGWRYAGRKGCWKRLLRHIYEVVCARDPAKFRWLIDWLSHTLQTTGDPSRRSPVSPVVWGPKGGGKSLPFDLVADCFGNHGMTVSHKEQLIGKFNRHLMMCLFVVAEEAVYAHDRQGEGPLKDLLTRKSLTVEPKGVDAFTAPNYCRFVFVSNESLAVPMTTDERRYQPFRISAHRVGDKTWFDAILAEMRGGGYEAMMHDLMHRTYDDGRIWFPLEDSADLDAMRAVVLEPPVRFALAWIAHGRVELTQPAQRALPDRCASAAPGQPARAAGLGGYACDPASSTNDVLELTEDTNFVASAEVKAAYDLWCRENLDTFELRKATRTTEALVRQIREALPFVGSHRTASARSLTLPPLTECRELMMKLPVLAYAYRQIDDAAEIGDDI